MFNLIFFFIPLACFAFEPFAQTGYLQRENQYHRGEIFEELYLFFDRFVDFLKERPDWQKKLEVGTKRFVESKERSIYTTRYHGFYADWKSCYFYYSPHYHRFLLARYPELREVEEMVSFLDACRDIHEAYPPLLEQTARELEIESLFNGEVPALLKVVKYFPNHDPIAPHYDHSAFTLMLHSTDSTSLLFSPYRDMPQVEDFKCAPGRENSFILIPGIFLIQSGVALYPTPHVVIGGDSSRHAAILFVMLSNYHAKPVALSGLPLFKN